MNEASFLVLLLNFVTIGALPKVFFRRGGRFNLMWWATSAPFVLCVIFVALTFSGVMDDRFFESTPLEVASVVLAVASIALITFTLGTHRVPVSLWHQKENLPEHLVTYGAYSRIRHPFYASFILALLGAFLYSPQPEILALLLYGFLFLNFTAAREEKQLVASPHGAEYRGYLLRTGRFWPKLWGRTV